MSINKMPIYDIGEINGETLYWIGKLADKKIYKEESQCPICGCIEERKDMIDANITISGDLIPYTCNSCHELLKKAKYL